MNSIEYFVNVMRQASVAAVNAQKLTTIVYGTVESVSPLKIRSDQKLLLEKEQLKLTRAGMDYEVEMTVDHVTELTTCTSSHTHEYKGRKKIPHPQQFSNWGYSDYDSSAWWSTIYCY